MPIGWMILIFLLLFAFVLALIAFSLRVVEGHQKKKVGDLLRTQEEEEQAKILEESSILKVEADASRLRLSELAGYRKLETKILQSGIDTSPGIIAGVTVVAACVGALLGLRIDVPVFREFGMIGLAAFAGSVPYLYVMKKRKARLAAFEEQFPEALDFLARSMRAGHAFSVSLETMADESPAPVGTEFRRVFHEQNLGSPLEVALTNLARRVPLLDVDFFVASVLMQRETGGNLAEILTKLGYLIRERFRLKGQVRASSAHGRLTAAILSILPIVTMMALIIVAPDYLSSMAKDEDGRWLIVGVIVLQMVGFLWMKKVINIKV